jgi:putative sporulation protein YyaC
LQAASQIDSFLPDAPDRIAFSILRVATDLGRALPLTVVCVGTDRSTGDSLGPLVGSMLEVGGFAGAVVGNLDDPVHAENLSQVVGCLSDYRDSLVLGVDACLGTKAEVGAVMVKPGPLRPGLGVRKKLAPVGHMHLAGVVNVGGFMEYMVLQNTRLSLVVRMARAISSGIQKADSLLRNASGKPRPEPILSDDAIPLVPTNDARLSLLPRAFVRQR